VGIGEQGALLVRPDHIIAWRCPVPAADSDLGNAITHLLAPAE
jgi:hypothetical protein